MKENKHFSVHANKFDAQSFWYILSCIIVIVLFLIMSMFFVPTMDDCYYIYGLNSDSLIKSFDNALVYGNGRLIGNAFGMFFANHRVLSALMKTFFLVSIALLTEKLTDIKKLFLPAFAGITFVNFQMFIETVAWNASFCNYIPPVFFILLSLVMLKKYSNKRKFLFIPVIMLSTFFAQFFVEHNAIVNAFLLLLFTFYDFKNRNNTRKFVSLAAFITSCIGGLLNFLLPKLVHNLNSDVNAHSDTIFDCTGITQIIKKCFGVFSLASKMISLDLLLFGFITIIVFIALKKLNITFKFKKLFSLMLFLIVPLAIIQITYDKMLYNTMYEDIGDALRLFICILYLVSLAVCINKIIKDKKILCVVNLCFAASVVSLVPFIFVSPVNYRNMYILHFLFVIISALTAGYLKKESVISFKGFRTACFTVAAVISCVLIVLYADCYKIYEQRTVSFEYQTGHNCEYIYLPWIDNRLVHVPNNGKIYNNYKGINKDRYVFLPYDEWMEEYSYTLE